MPMVKPSLPSPLCAVLMAAGLVARLVTPSAAEQGISFSKIFTEPDLGFFGSVLAVIDFNNDGHADIVVGGGDITYNGETPEERHTKTPVWLMLSEGDGRFRYAPELVDGEIEARVPVVVADDFNNDDQADLAVFDYGVYVPDHSMGYGNPPQLFLSDDDGILHRSTGLADAVEREHTEDPVTHCPGGECPSDLAALHLKTATSGDIDGDGDPDLWIESTGGANVTNHLMVNHGDGTFAIEEQRIHHELLHNPPPEYWRHYRGHFVDVDNDDDLDLVLGQMRDLDPTHVNQASIVLVNDGTGYYRTRIELPHVPMNEGYTEVYGITHSDVNDDGLLDLLFLHTRNDDGPLGVLPFTGRYIQVLVNRGDLSFADETSTRMGDQAASTSERSSVDNEELRNFGDLRMHDVDRDGCDDLTLWESVAPIRTESPVAYVNNGSGQFRALPPEPFVGESLYLGYLAVPADVNGDGAVDFVMALVQDGPDEEYGTADDFSTLLTLVNTTPAASVRCEVDPGTEG